MKCEIIKDDLIDSYGNYFLILKPKTKTEKELLKNYKYKYNKEKITSITNLKVVMKEDYKNYKEKIEKEKIEKEKIEKEKIENEIENEKGEENDNN